MIIIIWIPASDCCLDSFCVYFSIDYLCPGHSYRPAKLPLGPGNLSVEFFTKLRYLLFLNALKYISKDPHTR